MRIVPLSMQLPRAVQALNKSIKYRVTAWAGIVHFVQPCADVPSQHEWVVCTAFPLVEYKSRAQCSKCFTQAGRQV